MDNKEEQYLDNLLKSVMGQDAAEIMENAARQNQEEQETIAEEETGVDFEIPEDVQETAEKSEEEEISVEEEMEEKPVVDAPVVESSVEEETMSDELKLDDLEDELKIDDIEGFGDEPKSLDLDLEALGDDITLDDISFEDGTADDMDLQDIALNDMTTDSVETKDMALDDIVIDDEEDVLASLKEEQQQDVIPEATEPDMPETADAAETADEKLEMEEPVIEEEDLSAVLSGAEEDSDLSEINELLKTADGNEMLEEDDMMKLLEQIADDEEASVDAEDKNKAQAVETQRQEAAPKPEDEPQKEKKKKERKRKKAKQGETEEPVKEKVPKKKGVLGKLFDVLTEELVPEPTDEELAMEAAEKQAKKEAEKVKKEEEKAAKEEEKKAKDEEKAAAKKAKEEEKAAKKKAKEEEKAKKAAEKKAKEEADPSRKKRISPKKLFLVAVLAASVFAIVMVFSHMISKEGMLKRARKAYYAGDYATVYQELYGQSLNESDTLVKERSRIILTMQRKYDSYVNHLKMRDELKALDALITGVETYYLINTEAETYGCLEEVKSIRTDIIDILSSDYGISEQDALQLLQQEDEVSYTKALKAFVE